MPERPQIDIYDLHSHFLPGIDDGCKSPEESVEVLSLSMSQGVRGIAATPHYYPKESVEEFLKRRTAAARRLRDYIVERRQKIPAIVLGAEVAYRPGISREERLRDLCIGRSDYLLLEMPFERWNEEVSHDLREICGVWGITPIIAHIERYAKYQTKKTLDDLTSSPVLIQMNAEYILEKSTRGKALKYLKEGFVQVVGSDCHNMVTRRPNIGEALDILGSKSGPLLDALVRNREVFEEIRAVRRQAAH